MKTFPLSRLVLCLAFTMIFIGNQFFSTPALADDGPKAVKKSAFANTKWIMNRINVDGVLQKPAADKIFNFSIYDSTITITSFCNNISANFAESENGVFKFHKIDFTQRLCSENSMMMEKEYIDILHKVTSYNYDDRKNTITFMIGSSEALVLSSLDNFKRAVVAPNGRR